MNASKRPGPQRRQEDPAAADPAVSWALLGVLAFSGVLGYCGVSAMLMVSSLPASPVRSVMYYGLVLVAPAVLFVACLAAITLAVNLFGNRPLAQPDSAPKAKAASRQPGLLARTMKPLARTPAKKKRCKGPARKRLR